MIAIKFRQNRMSANLLPNCVISNNIIGIFVVDQAPRKMKILVIETPFLRKTIATGNEAYNGPDENEPKIKAKIPPYSGILSHEFHDGFFRHPYIKQP